MDPSPSINLSIVPYNSPIFELNPPDFSNPPNPNPVLDIPTPGPHVPLQQLCAPLQELSSDDDDDDDDQSSEYHRLCQLFTSSNGSGGGGDSGGFRKKKPRLGEMVRVSRLEAHHEMYYRDLVRRTRITYESLRILLMNEEKAEKLGLLVRKCRPDLKVGALMTDRDLWLNRGERIIGSIPWINIGDVYFYRMEMCVIGLHGQNQAGIDFVPAKWSSSGEPIATSIIVSGGYEDDDDHGDELIYTGQGGRDPNLHKHCVGQKLQRGNLGLERSMNYGIEVRVIRGVKSNKSPTNIVYVYDGLYKVVQCWVDVGKSGFEVYKYKLLRIEGQEEMGSVVLQRANKLKVDPLSVRPSGYLSLDMSNGKENFPVLLFNDIDEDHDPLLFEYAARPVYPQGLKEKVFCDWGGGCQCMVNCTADCYCAKMNCGELPYDVNGILLRGKPVVYECGSSCRCPPSCPNRVTQRGLTNRLEVFRSVETGWGIRSLDLIRAGSFICEFAGVVLTKQQADLLSTDGECLVCPNRFPGRWVEWGDISDVFPDYTPPSLPSLPEPEFAIDVSRVRNVACYMSHSGSPNVFVQFVLYDHYNVAYPHLMIFASENIPPLRELSIDYGVVDESVGKLTM